MISYRDLIQVVTKVNGAFKNKFALIILLSLVAGCTRALRVTPLGEPVIGEASSEIATSFARYAEQVNTYRALLTVQIESSRGRENIKLIVVIDQHNRARIEVLPPSASAIGYSAMVGWLTDQGSTLVDNIEKKAYLTEDPGIGFRSLLGISLTPRDLKMILSGRPIIDLNREVPGLYSLKTRSETQFIESSSGTDWEFNSQDKIVSRLTVRQRKGRDEFIEVNYQRYLQLSEISVPQSLDLYLRRSGAIVRIFVDNIKVNSEVKEQLMNPVVPSAYSVERISGVAEDFD